MESTPHTPVWLYRSEAFVEDLSDSLQCHPMGLAGSASEARTEPWSGLHGSSAWLFSIPMALALLGATLSTLTGIA